MSKSTKGEHEHIARFLKKEFIPYCNRHGYKFKINLDIFLKVIQNSYQENQENIADLYSTEIRKSGLEGEVSQSKISRAIDKINKKLKVFCQEINIAPSIQIFNRYINPISGIRTPFGCFIACSKALKGQKNCAEKIVTLKEAKTRGKRKSEDRQVSISRSTQRAELDLQRKVIESDPNRKQSLFRFEYRSIEFVGREEEMQRLRKFAGHKDEKLLWWVITGSGGTGKSRLALEFCLELEKKNWHAGFLADPKTLETSEKWLPSKPTLIVVDYAFEKIKELGECVSGMYERSRHWKYPIRILLLERRENSEAIEQFSYPNWPVIEKQIRYNNMHNVNEEASLKLEGLGDSFIDAMITGIFSKYDKCISADEIKMIRSFLKGEKHRNRPLYVMFAADACARNENIRNWNMDELHDNVLRHNRNIWQEAGIDEKNKEDRKHINLLILATMVNGVDIESDAYAKCLEMALDNGLHATDILPAIHELYDDKYQILCDYEITKELGPMAPDILGEYFVSKEWGNNRIDVCRMKLLTKIAWQYSPMAVVDFAARIECDFSADKVIDSIVETASLDGDNYEMASLLHSLTQICSLTGKLDKAIEYYEYMKNVQKRGRLESDAVSIVLAREERFLALAHIAEGKIDKAVEYYNHTEALSENSYQKDKELPTLLAQVALHLARHFGMVGEKNKATEFVKSAKRRLRTVCHDDSAILRTLVELSIDSADACGRVHLLDEAIGFYELAKKLWKESGQNDDNLRNKLTSLSLDLVCYFEQTGKIDKTVELLMRFERL